DMVWTTLNVELSKVGEEVTTLQSILDGIMPGLIGLGGTWMYYWLLKKKVNPIMLILGTMVLGIAGAYFGILAG
ncbi:MAG: PTS system mannose/fructose/sorbose family transporter subunit IID, partial [[Clostridium] innocuum]